MHVRMHAYVYVRAQEEHGAGLPLWRLRFGRLEESNLAGPQPLLAALYTTLADFLSGNLRRAGLQALACTAYPCRPAAPAPADALLPHASSQTCTTPYLSHTPSSTPTHTHASSSHVELCTLLTYRLTLGGAVHGGSPAAAAAAAPATSLGPHSATAALARHLGGTPASLPAHSHRHIWLQCVSYSVAAFVACGCSLCHVRLQALFATGSFISVREMSGVAGVPELGCELLQLLNCLAYLGPQAFPTDATFESFAYELVS